jgi:hypothetical protein
VAVAVAGAVALAIFLLVDLPDANQVGTVTGETGTYLDAEANPAGGFYLELVSALALTIAGLALALLTPHQLAKLRPTHDGPGKAKRPQEATKGKPPDAKRRPKKAGGSRVAPEAAKSKPSDAKRRPRKASSSGATPEAAKSKPGKDAGRAPKRA